ncbi:MAG: hypothetical protein KDJ45_00565 [Hyphomicrobiaceae bacterium]|nr:hypothetical protein [Hyphomicrobiaceae bacterium]
MANEPAKTDKSVSGGAAEKGSNPAAKDHGDKSANARKGDKANQPAPEKPSTEVPVKPPSPPKLQAPPMPPPTPQPPGGQAGLTASKTGSQNAADSSPSMIQQRPALSFLVPKENQATGPRSDQAGSANKQQPAPPPLPPSAARHAGPSGAPFGTSLPGLGETKDTADSAHTTPQLSQKPASRTGAIGQLGRVTPGAEAKDGKAADKTNPANPASSRPTPPSTPAKLVVPAPVPNAAKPGSTANLPPPLQTSSGASGRPALAFAARGEPAQTQLNREPELEDEDGGYETADDEAGGDKNEDTELPRRMARRRPAGPARGKVAANDDAPSIGGLIYALEQKPSSKIYRYATIGSIAWAAIGIIFGAVALTSEASITSWATVFTRPTTFLTLAGIVVPIAVIWLLAILSWRAEELRLRSSTMTEVAIRLAEPDRMAEDSVASLGQAVRRQVNFMNEAVGRALGRAGELEALVHNEVAALERSYEENERRIRGLISELANERQALTSTSTSFNDTLRTLGREVPTLIERLSNQQTNLSRIIQGAGDNLNLLESSLAKSVSSLETELGGRTNELQGVLETYTGALGQALGSRTEQLGVMLGSHGERLQTMLDDRSKHLGKSIGGQTDEMQKMLETYTGALAQALGSRTAQMQASFAEHMGKLDTAIANRTSNLQAVFEEYARALDSTLSNRASTLDQRLIERTRALDSAFEDRLKLFDQSIKDSTRAIDEAVETRATALTSALESHARTFSETISRQSMDLDDSLNQGITAVRRTSENITRQSLKAIESLAGQSDMLKSVSENLVSQIGSLTNRFEAQGQTILKAANALESVNYKIDSTLQSRHAELSETLDRMVGKADEFTRHVKDYSTTIEGTLSDAEARALAAAEQLKIGTETHRDRAFGEIERLKAETDAESQRALESLKNRLSSVSEEVSTQLGSLTSRFSETSDDVRKRAQRVAEELEREQRRMREEAERLPQTSRETATAMRQALQDQLRAIDQLSSLATNEAQRRDVGLPVAQGGALKPAEFSGPSSHTAGIGNDGNSAPTTAARSTSDTGGARSRSLTSLSETLASELGPRPGGAGGSASRDGDGNPAHVSSWSLGDLLKRASNDEAAAARQSAPANPTAQHRPHPGASETAMQPFKLDIEVLARALDGATAATIWQRLRAGQRGIMVRSIYSADGRNVFDEVVRRYPTDPNLHATINRYIADFERILRDSEARDNTGRLAQSQITSTMGRVYLLLAHASGRIS